MPVPVTGRRDSRGRPSSAKTISLSNADGTIRRGRRPGTKNRPNAKVSQEAIRLIRNKLGPHLPDDDLTYLTDVMEGHVGSDLNRDIDILIVLQMKALLPLLAGEIEFALGITQGPPEEYVDDGPPKRGRKVDPTTAMSKEITSRSSVVKELLALRFQMNKSARESGPTSQTVFIQNVFTERIDQDRLLALLGSGNGDGLPRLVSAPLSGDDDRVVDGEWSTADKAGDLPSELPQRQEQVPAGGQE
jgi:hypothetical protein